MRQRPSTSPWSLPVDEAMRNTLWKVRRRGNHKKGERETEAEAIRSECNSISFSLVPHCISRRHCRHCYSGRLLHSMGYIDLAMRRWEVLHALLHRGKIAPPHVALFHEVSKAFSTSCVVPFHYIARIENMGMMSVLARWIKRFYAFPCLLKCMHRGRVQTHFWFSRGSLKLKLQNKEGEHTNSEKSTECA